MSLVSMGYLSMVKGTRIAKYSVMCGLGACHLLRNYGSSCPMDQTHLLIF